MRSHGAIPPLAAATDPQPDTEVAGDAIDSLYRAHAIGLTRLALVLTGDRTTAEDVVQDSFLGLFRGWSRLRDPGRALGYLRTSVVNGCRSAQRARKTAWLRGEPREQHDPPPVWSAEAAAMASEDQREVLAAVARLPRRQREVLALRYYAGLPDGEIAALLRVSRGTVSSTASRALAVLARQLRAQQ